ncbi:IS4 family transposase [Vulcanibacillus modesticaldus]|uniref:IS4 family transposase n=1 Tax=Vulcanibacillus modesticaldus TaxID=337097 RepID=A0A1D2YSC7_9BACI|nr:IS4 family transposase [Vulcanibacillus modesticaldus]OEF97204.1 IS4 family transposase [Vulcanibacillus modesticaldus]
MDKDTLFSSFGKWIAPINSVKLQQKVEEMKQDKYVKKLTTRAYLLLFLHAQIEQREGLRAIADDVLLEEFQQELGLTSISASQLSRKHNQVNPDLLAEIFFDLVGHIRRKSSASSKFKGLKIVDSTTISLGLKKYKWAKFRKTKAGIKIHLRLEFVDDETVYPEKFIVTPASKNDRTQMDVLIDEKDVMYIFDRGYNDYEKFDHYCDEGIFFASRLKKNAIVRVLETFNIPENSSIKSDSMVVIGTPQNRMDNVLRLIETVDSENNEIRIITNRFDLDAEEIGEIYRSRWAIELFFKWMKQHLKIKHLYGTSEEAVLNQVYLTLIAYSLMVLIQLETKTKQTLLQISRWLRILLWKPYDNWIKLMVKAPG